MRVTALVGLLFLSFGYAAPIAMAFREFRGPTALVLLELPELAFPVFDPDAKAGAPADKHDAADAGLPADDGGDDSGGSGGAGRGDDAEAAAPEPTGDGTQQPASVPAGQGSAGETAATEATGGQPAAAQQQTGPAPEVVDNRYDIEPPPAPKEKDPNAGAPTYESSTGAPLLTPLTDPIALGHSQAPLDELATNPLGEPSTVLTPDTGSDSSDPGLDAPGAQVDLPDTAAGTAVAAQDRNEARKDDRDERAPKKPKGKSTAKSVDQVIAQVLTAAAAYDEAATADTVETTGWTAAPAEQPESFVVAEQPVAAPQPVAPEPAAAAPAPEAAAPAPAAEPAPAAPANQAAGSAPAPVQTGSMAQGDAPATIAPVAASATVAPAPTTWVAPAVVAVPVAPVAVYVPPPPPPVTDALLEATATVLVDAVAIVPARSVDVAPAADASALAGGSAVAIADQLTVDLGGAGLAMAAPANDPADATSLPGATAVVAAGSAAAGERQDETAYEDVAAGAGDDPSGGSTELAELAAMFAAADTFAERSRGPPAGDQNADQLVSGTDADGISSDLLTHAACLDHEPGRYHPERPERLRAVLAALDDAASPIWNAPKRRAPGAARALPPGAVHRRIMAAIPPAGATLSSMATPR